LMQETHRPNRADFSDGRKTDEVLNFASAKAGREPVTRDLDGGARKNRTSDLSIISAAL
jgi:hypothetical protein